MDHSKENQIVVTGINVDVLKDDLALLEREFPNYTFATVPKHGQNYTKASCGQESPAKVERRAPKSFRTSEWEVVKQASTQLLVSATEMSKSEVPKAPAAYAVIPAHLILDEDKCEKYASADSSIQHCREDVERTTTRTRFAMRVAEKPDKMFYFRHPPLFGYRHWYKTVHDSHHSVSVSAAESTETLTEAGIASRDSTNGCISGVEADHKNSEQQGIVFVDVTHPSGEGSTDEHSAEEHSAEEHSAEEHSEEEHYAEETSAEKHSAEEHSADSCTAHVNSADKQSTDTKSAAKNSTDQNFAEGHFVDTSYTDKHFAYNYSGVKSVSENISESEFIANIYSIDKSKREIESHHMYMNDVGLMYVEGYDVEDIHKIVSPNKQNPVREIKTEKELQKLCSKNQAVVIGGKEGHLVPRPTQMLTEMTSQGCYALFLPFILTSKDANGIKQ